MLLYLILSKLSLCSGDAGEELGMVLRLREPAVRRGGADEPPQGVQDAADGWAGTGEAARWRVGAAE